ncbi:PIN domain-containing protein [Escherichia coli]|uniref:PIN domain-containing protein n=1 Tax=Escherichia coli TaxID=562 RepID=UPI000246ED50|nr:PIN domain-containing protein [Escherichia coli]EHN94165.1 hypothetical protein ESOG_04701 [Escherichia coli E101]
MKILLDTNIFHNSYYIKSTDLRLILNYINNENHVLLISDIVLKEVEKHFRDGYAAAKEKLTSALNEYNRFSPIGEEIKIEHLEVFAESDNQNPIKYSFLEQIYKYISKNKVIIIKSDEVPHQFICKKAFNIEKPFKKDGSGYKDSLIWLSFLNYLIENEVENEEVAFVSNNIHDFSDPEKISNNKIGPGALHNDLITDINSLNVKANIKYFYSVSNLIRHYSIEKGKYSTSHIEIKDYIENALFEIDLTTFLENSFFKKTDNINVTNSKYCIDLLFKANAVYINYLSKVSFEIIQIESNNLAISCRCRLDYSQVEIELMFNKNNNAYYKFLSNREKLQALNDDDFYLRRNCSMQIETTFTYVPKEKKEHDEDYGSITDMNIQYIYLDWFPESPDNHYH